jgi:ectoine hydroxylase-related dioxygenase (phytanoyl-CoA dioxygenase family)
MSIDINTIIEEIDERGYAIIPDAISLAEADAAREALNALRLAEQTAQHQEWCAQRVGRIAVKHQIFRDLMCNPIVVELWRKWLGPDMVCSTWSANTMMPGQTTYQWHADYPYWAMQPPWPAGNLTGQTIWMMDDFTEENGATGVVPYSHRKLVPPENIKEWRDDAEIATGRRGSVIVLHGAIWHTHRPNKSDGPRSALLGMYIRPALIPMEDMKAQLADIAEPSEELQQIMGKNVFVPGAVGS